MLPIPAQNNNRTTPATTATTTRINDYRFDVIHTCSYEREGQRSISTEFNQLN